MPIKAVPVPLQGLQELEQKIGIAFKDPTLLEEAMTHSSFANEYPALARREEPHRYRLFISPASQRWRSHRACPWW